MVPVGTEVAVSAEYDRDAQTGRETGTRRRFERSFSHSGAGLQSRHRPANTVR
jgi:hypothetical protein